MAKTLVVAAHGHQTRVPFLRGILTRSLQDAGLSFEEAYAVSSSVRDELSETAEVTTRELHQIVLRRLSDGFSDAVVNRYDTPVSKARSLLVRAPDGQATLFSREQHRRHLESSGLSYEDSIAVTTRIFDHLMKLGAPEITSRRLGLLTYRYIRISLSAEMARRYLVLVDFFRGKRPLILLIGGTPGCGKSAVATEAAHRLDIGRTQSTDLLREVMRTMVPQRLSPVLHTSSFNAWWMLPGKASSDADADSLLIDGFRTQAELLSVACEAVISRSLSERTSLTLEGVHVQHSLLARVPKDQGAVVVLVMLAVLNPGRLRERLAGRSDQAASRRAERYLENFEAIWRLQSHLLSEADRWHVPIIVNNDKEQVIADLMRTVVDHLLVDFTASPEEVFD